MNWPRLVVGYGQAVAWLLIAGSVAAVAWSLWRRRRFLPRGPFGWIGCAAAAVVIYYSAGFLQWARAKVDPLKPVFRQADQPSPDLTFQSLGDGTSHAVSELHGKVVLLNIWATWCEPCREEMPSLDRLQRAYEKDGLVVLAISDETPQQIAKFPGFAALQIMKGRVDADRPAVGLYVRPDVARPVTHIIDRDGILRETLIGGQNYAAFEKGVLPYLRR